MVRVSRGVEPYYNLVDVCKAHRHLCQKLPPELVSIILDNAEIWIGQAVERNDRYVVLSAWVHHSYSLYYLATDRLPVIRINGEIVSTKARRVRFTLLSHDQGWSTFPEDHGTYNGSGSWFEAGILKPATDFPKFALPTEILESAAFGTGGIEVVNPAGPFDRSFLQTFPGEPFGEFRRWFLQANLHAVSPEKKQHVIEWTHNDDDFPNAVTKNPGTGHGKGFIGALHSGNRICIVARAETPAWANYVYAAKIETFFTF